MKRFLVIVILEYLWKTLHRINNNEIIIGRTFLGKLILLRESFSKKFPRLSKKINQLLA